MEADGCARAANRSLPWITGHGQPSGLPNAASLGALPPDENPPDHPVADPPGRSTVERTGSSPYVGPGGVVLGAPRHRAATRLPGDGDRDMYAPTGHRASPDRTRRPSAFPAARLTLCPPTFPPGPVSGAWRPLSADLHTELPALVQGFGTPRGG
jgi:hypothetical protein